MVSKYSCILLLLLGSSLALPLDRAAADDQQYRGVFDKMDQVTHLKQTWKKLLPP